MIVTVVFVIPLLLLGAGHLLGFGACYRPDTAGVSGMCSPLGRLLFAALLIAIGVPLVLNWTRFLARILAFRDNDCQPLDDATGQGTPMSHTNASFKLALGQRLISGRIDFCSPSSHHIRIDGNALTFWSVYAFHKRWLKEGDQVVVVYQTVPLSKKLKLAMAFWSGPGSSARGVATGLQGAAALIAVGCILIFALLKPQAAAFFIPLLGFLIVVYSLYLVLMVRAKGALQDFIDREARN
jgi:hypothetical protein